jgi:peptidoglycan/LPS O-acetylase OafA/YrhL
MQVKGEPSVGARENNFELLRLFAALLVVYGHSYALLGAAPPGFIVNSVSTTGVKIFFAISGYLVTLSWLRDPNPIRFFQRRAVRIFPALAVVVLLSALVLGPALSELPGREYWRSGITPYLLNIVLYINYFLPGVFQKNIYPYAVNGSLWSLPVEFAMYILTPLVLGLPWIRQKSMILLAVGTAFVVFAVWKTQFSPPAQALVFYNTDVMAGLSLAPYFVVGMLIAVANRPHLLNIYAGFLALFALAMIETIAPVKETLLIIVLPYAVLAFGTGPSLRLLPRGLDLSYGIFLWGFPVEQIFSHFCGASLRPWPLFGVATLVSAGIATLSWTFVEKPFLRLKPRKRAAMNTAPSFQPLGDLQELSESVRL